MISENKYVFDKKKNKIKILTFVYLIIALVDFLFE